MFTNFLTQNFNHHLNNQNQLHLHPETQSHQSSSSQPQIYHHDPFQYQTNQHISTQTANHFQIPNLTDADQTNNDFGLLESTSFMESHSSSNRTDESHEYQRKPTFFSNPIFGSEMFMNHIKKQVENPYEESPNSNENPQKASNVQTKQIQVHQVEPFEAHQDQPKIIENTQNQNPCKNQAKGLNEKEQNYETILQAITENQNEQISETQKLFQMFDAQELQSKKIQAILESQKAVSFPQTISEQGNQESFDKHLLQQSIVNQISVNIDEQFQPKPSFLKQMSSKIKNSRIQFQKTHSNSKFSLKQFNQTLKKPKQLTPNLKSDYIQNHELYRAIFQLVTKKEDPFKKEPQEMQTIVQKLKQSILPHFQKLQSDYTEKITQMNDLVQGMILLNTKREKSPETQKKSNGVVQRRIFNVDQSAVQINLNDESSIKLRQIEEEGQNPQQILGVTVPVITRTDSVQGMFVSYNSQTSKTSEVDILASINSKEEESETNIITEDDLNILDCEDLKKSTIEDANSSA